MLNAFSTLEPMKAGDGALIFYRFHMHSQCMDLGSLHFFSHLVLMTVWSIFQLECFWNGGNKCVITNTTMYFYWYCSFNISWLKKIYNVNMPPIHHWCSFYSFHETKCLPFLEERFLFFLKCLLSSFSFIEFDGWGDEELMWCTLKKTESFCVTKLVSTDKYKLQSLKGVAKLSFSILFSHPFIHTLPHLHGQVTEATSPG